MERLQIREISRQLAQSQRMSIGDAERFVTEMFSAISDELKANKLVIIDGLGTFKQSKTQDKEIITLSPDEDLADELNAPFANFKTVEITVDVDEEGELIVDSAKDAVENEQAEPEKLDDTEPTSEQTEPTSEQTETAFEQIEEQKPSQDIAVEDKVDALAEKVDALTENLERKAMIRKRIYKYVVALFVIVVVEVVGVSIYLSEQQKEQERLAQQEKARLEEIRLQEIKHKQDSINNIKKNIASLDLTDEQKLEIVGKGKNGVPEYPCAMSLQNAKALVPMAGYKIVGTRKVVEIGKEQTLQDVADEYGLQQGEFLIQVYNAVESVKEGQKIRIPLVELK